MSNTTYCIIQSHESVVKALAEDPSVFEYDNIYDDLQEKKKKSDPRLQKIDTRVCADNIQLLLRLLCTKNLAGN